MSATTKTMSNPILCAAEFERIAEYGHAIVLVQSTTCKSCSLVLPMWREMAQQFQFSDKWKFYDLDEQYAKSQLDTLQIVRVPCIIVWRCPPTAPEILTFESVIELQNIIRDKLAAAIVTPCACMVLTPTRPLLGLGPLVCDSMYSWIYDTVTFAADPVSYWRAREGL